MGSRHPIGSPQPMRPPQPTGPPQPMGLLYLMGSRHPTSFSSLRHCRSPWDRQSPSNHCNWWDSSILWHPCNPCKVRSPCDCRSAQVPRSQVDRRNQWDRRNPCDTVLVGHLLPFLDCRSVHTHICTCARARGGRLPQVRIASRPRATTRGGSPRGPRALGRWPGSARPPRLPGRPGGGSMADMRRSRRAGAHRGRPRSDAPPSRRLLPGCAPSGMRTAPDKRAPGRNASAAKWGRG